MPKALTAKDYDTDKGVNAYYLSNFQEHLGHLADQPVSLLELGVHHGGSLLMWRDYFAAGRIVGIDMDPVSLDDDTGRVEVFRGMQQDTRFLDDVASRTAPNGFDVIIDDASHIAELTRISFWHLFEHHLKPGGIYVIEDWGTGYWSKWFDGKDYAERTDDTSKIRSQSAATKPALPADRTETTRKQSLSSTIEWYARKLGVRNFQLPAILRGQRFRKRFPSHDYGMVGFIKELVDECGMGDITNPEYTHRAHRPSKFERMVISHGHAFVYKKR